MPKVSKTLSDIHVRRLKHSVSSAGKERAALHAVGGVSGLYIQCSPPSASNSKGSKSWILRTVIGGKRRDLGLGSYPNVSLTKARELARERKQSIANGIDPIAEAKSKKSALVAQQAQEITFEALAKEFTAIKTKEWKTAPQVRRLKQYLTDYAYPHLGSLLVRDIRREHLVKMLKPIWEEKTPTAVRLINYVEAIIHKGIVEGLRKDSNPAIWKHNLDQSFPKASKVHKVQHQRSVDWRVMPEFMKKLFALDAPIGSRPEALCLAFIILTISRPTEARLADWSEIDLEKKIWNIPTDAEGRKSDVEWKIPLTDQAVRILESMPSREGRIFSTLAGRKIPDNYVSSIPDALGYDGVAHGFRTTFRTWGQEQQRFTEEALELCLKHLETDSTRAAYARSQLVEERRKILEAYEHWLFSGDKDNKVIPMTKRRGRV